MRRDESAEQVTIRSLLYRVMTCSTAARWALAQLTRHSPVITSQRLNPTPTARAEGAGAGEAPARIEIEAGGQVFFNHVPVGGPRDALLPELRERLRAVRGAVRIEPNPRARQARVAAVLDACAAAGVARVSLQGPEE